MVACRLYDATVEGRLLADELDERLGVALSARTYGELEPLIEDLPGPRATAVREHRLPLVVCVLAALMILLAAVGTLLWRRW